MTAKRQRARSWSQFDDRFEPVIRDDGSLIWHNDEIPRPIDFHHWWTVLDCDGKLYVAPGFRWVNRIGFIRTRVPWTRDDELDDYRYD